MRPTTLHLTGDRSADDLLSSNPLALLIAMVLDQQIPLERAFKAPSILAERLGGRLNALTVSSTPPDDFVELFSQKPALHRFPKSMAGRVQQVCQVLLEDYGGKAESIWADARDGRELVARLEALPGFGAQKARIFAALLAKQLGVRPKGWEAATHPYGAPETFISVADVTDPESLERVRAFKRAAKSGPEKSGPEKSGPEKSGPVESPKS